MGCSPGLWVWLWNIMIGYILSSMIDDVVVPHLLLTHALLSSKILPVVECLMGIRSFVRGNVSLTSLFPELCAVTKCQMHLVRQYLSA